jgi:hypothetical protein
MPGNKKTDPRDAGSASANAKILQNGSWSNGVTFTVSTPHIIGISPTSGSAGTSVTITGTRFGATQGAGTVTLGSLSGQVISWNDTQVVALVASGARSGLVRIHQGQVQAMWCFVIVET